jgi:hypothetical protein
MLACGIYNSASRPPPPPLFGQQVVSLPQYIFFGEKIVLILTKESYEEQNFETTGVKATK